MNLSENLLTILIEECNETAQRATKALRFGLTEVQPGQDKTNAERIVYEFNDIVAVMELLRKRSEYFPEIINREMILLKKEKITKYTFLSYKEGAITGEWEDPHLAMPDRDVELELIVRRKDDAGNVVLKRAFGQRTVSDQLSLFRMVETGMYGDCISGKDSYVGSFIENVVWWRLPSAMPQGL